MILSADEIERRVHDLQKYILTYEDAYIFVGLSLTLCAVYGAAYLYEHSQSLKYQIENLRPLKRIKAGWTKHK